MYIVLLKEKIIMVTCYMMFVLILVYLLSGERGRRVRVKMFSNEFVIIQIHESCAY